MNTERRLRLGRIPVRITLIVLASIFVFPVLFALNTSFKTLNEFYTSIWALPQKLQFINYVEAFITGQIGQYFLNSLLIAVVTLASIQVLALSAAYSLSRLKIPGSNYIILGLFLINILPKESIIIPLYITLSKAGIMRIPFISTMLGYIGWSLPGSIIILKNFFETIPAELIEAARIDGSGEVSTMVRIVLPLMKSAMATVMVFNFIFVWGELMWARITTLLTSRGIPLTVGLINFQDQYGTDWPRLTAAVCMVIIPLFGSFIFLQKYFVKGLTSGSVKG